MDPIRDFEIFTPQEAAKRFHQDFPQGTETQAMEFADIHFSESLQLREFQANWRQLRGFADQVKQAEFRQTVERIWPEDKYG